MQLVVTVAVTARVPEVVAGKAATGRTVAAAKARVLSDFLIVMRNSM